MAKDGSPVRPVREPCREHVPREPCLQGWRRWRAARHMLATAPRLRARGCRALPDGSAARNVPWRDRRTAGGRRRSGTSDKYGFAERRSLQCLGKAAATTLRPCRRSPTGKGAAAGL